MNETSPMEEMLRHLPRRELGAAAEAKLLSRLRRARPRRRVRMSVWQAAACVVLSFAGGVASAPALRRAVPAPAGPSAAPAAAPVIVAVDASLFGSPPTNELSAARWTVLSTRGDE